MLYSSQILKILVIHLTILFQLNRHPMKYPDDHEMWVGKNMGGGSDLF
jgi:hypothetical protein